MTLSEFIARQREWFLGSRSQSFNYQLRKAVGRYYEWAGGDSPIDALTMDSIKEFEAIDDTPQHMKLAQVMRTVRRRYLEAEALSAEPMARVVETPPEAEDVSQIEPLPGPTPQPELPLSRLAQIYVATNVRLRSEHSRRLVRYSITQYQDYLGREGTLSDLSDQALVAFANYRRSLGRSERTIERELSKLSTLWRYAGNHGWCPQVHFSVQKCAPPTPTAWSPQEMAAIFKAATEYSSTICGLPANLVMLAALRLAYDTGERRSAIFAVQWRDIDLDRRYVTYRAETRKGGVKAADNVQRFTRQTAKALVELRNRTALLGKDSERVFPDMHITTIYGHLKFVLKSCGLNAGRNCMFHKIRRTHATHLYLAGGDPTQSLGHDSDAMTRGYYLDPKFTRNSFLADLVGIRGLFARLARPMKRLLGII